MNVIIINTVFVATITTTNDKQVSIFIIGMMITFIGSIAKLDVLR